MITANTLEALSDLLERARKKLLKVNPQIKIVEAGLYKVEGSKGNWYDVRAGRNGQGEFFIACTCRGGIEGKACYHAAKTFDKHVSLKSLEIRLRKNDEMNNAPYLPPSSDKKPEKVGKYRV